jgi:hypothetical protein
MGIRPPVHYLACLPDGAVGTPSWAFASETNTGAYTTGSGIRFAVDGALEVTLFNDVFAFIGTGTAANPLLTLGNDSNTGLYAIGADNLGLSVGGALVMDWEDTNAAGAGADLVTISSTLGAMDDGADIFRGLNVALTNADHTGGIVYGIDVQGITGDAQATESAIIVGAGWDVVLSTAKVPGATTPTFNFTDATVGFIGLSAKDWYEIVDLGDEFYWQHDLGPSTIMKLSSDPFNQAASSTVLEIEAAVTAMDGSDTKSIFVVDVVNPDHTGSSNVLNGILVDGITADGQATERAASIGSGWEVDIYLADSTGLMQTAGGMVHRIANGNNWSVEWYIVSPMATTGQWTTVPRICSSLVMLVVLLG